MRLAAAYNPILRAHDPEMRVRWSDRLQLWVLERRARYERKDLDPDIYGDKEHDTYIALRDGYFAIGYYQGAELPTVHQLIDYLKREDSWRGGPTDLQKLAEAIADELDADYAQREAEKRAKGRQLAGEIAGEVWESDRWKSGERVTVPRSLPSP